MTSPPPSRTALPIDRPLPDPPIPLQWVSSLKDRSGPLQASLLQEQPGQTSTPRPVQRRLPTQHLSMKEPRP